MIRNVHIELTSNCNLKCKMCLAQKNKDILSFEQFLKIIEQLKRFNDEGKTDIVNVEIAGHGEPLLYKDIIKVLKIVKSNFRRISLVTNGVLLTEEMSKKILELEIDHIEISITGVDPIIYSEFQGYECNKLDEVLNNINNLINVKRMLKKKTTISVSYIKSDSSSSHISKYINYWKKRHVDRIYIHPLITDAEINATKCKSCYMIGQSLFIHSNGDVKVCCYDFKRELVIGNMINNTLESILSSNKYVSLINRNQKLEFDEMPQVCQRCSNLHRKSVVTGYCNRKRLIYFAPKDRAKGFLWEVGIYIYEIMPPCRLLYSLFYNVKNKLNIF